MLVERRTLIAGGAPAALRAQFQPARKHRVVIIGHTGRGNYGHGWEMSWIGIPNVEVAAVADPDDEGRTAARRRCGAGRDYRDYREMIAREKPDIVTICPRWCDQRVEMVTAAAAAGAHILVEKPLAQSLQDADAIVRVTETAGVKVQVGHTARAMDVTARTRDLLRSGQLGRLLEIRARGKEDRRAGGEDLIVLGSHCFDLMRYFAGDPLWVFAHVSEKGREVDSGMMRQAGEPVGAVGGDNIAAMYLFPHGVHGYFSSMLSEDRSGRRFGVTLAGTKGIAFVPLSAVPGEEPWILRSPAWVPEKGESWERIRYGARPATREETNRLMALDLLQAIEGHREPLCSARDGRWTVEMAAAVYQSQQSGTRAPFPLRNRTS